jgi:hypothetical protein
MIKKKKHRRSACSHGPMCGVSCSAPVVGIVQGAHCAILSLYILKNNTMVGRGARCCYRCCCYYNNNDDDDDDAYFDPSTSDGSFAAGHVLCTIYSYISPHPPVGLLCVGACACACCWSSARLFWPVIRTSEAYLLLEREPNTHYNIYIYIYIYIYINVCRQQEPRLCYY